MCPGRILIVAAVICVLTVGSVVSCSNESPPSIILITLDTIRADQLGLYGRSPSPSPNLDRFATQAVVYDRAYSASSWTLPSHASLFTGLIPTQHGAGSPLADSTPRKWRYTPLVDDFTTLAELFSQAGYQTAAVVGGPALDPGLGIAQGFDQYEFGYSRPGEKRHGTRGDFIADRAIEFIRKFDTSAYFLFLNFFDPHRPYEPPEPHGRDLPDRDPRAEQRVISHLGSPARPIADFAPSERTGIDALLAAYLAEIRYMDEHLGRLFAAIEALPPERRPVVAITSDHGESFGEHYQFTHGLHLYEDNTRVPLIFYDPQNRRGSRSSDLVPNRRLFATLLGVAGIEVPPIADSATLFAPAASLVTELWRTENAIAVFGESAARDLRAIYLPPHKLIESSDGNIELYDLDSDPDELVNLIDLEPERAASMAKRLSETIGDASPLFTAENAAPLNADAEEALRALGYLNSQQPHDQP